jgi:phosphoglycerate dehydrogenase-like enzyme
MADKEETRGILNKALFETMPPYATFINTGRGAQVAEQDLCDVLSARSDLTAILDVTFPEPPEADSPLYTVPNVFLTPHIAGSLGNEVHRMAEYMYEEYKAFDAGQPTRYGVTIPMLATMA